MRAVGFRPPFRSQRQSVTREITYLHEDEQAAVEQAAQRLRCSRSEVIRRAVRAWFEIED